jgi:hypothetical protein
MENQSTLKVSRKFKRLGGAKTNMYQLFTDIPLPFLSPGDAVKYLPNDSGSGARPAKVKDLLYEMAVVVKPLLRPQGLVCTLPVVAGEVELGGQRYPLSPGETCLQVSFLVITLGAALDDFIADLTRSSAPQAVVADALAWQAVEQAQHFLFETLLQQALEADQQIKKSSPWPEDFLEIHTDELHRALPVEAIGIGSPPPQKTFWGIVRWAPWA